MSSKRVTATAVLIALCAESCSAHLAAPTSLEAQASTMLVDWDDIPASMCTPPLHGMYLSYQGGADLLEREDAKERVCEHRINAAETGQKIAEAKCRDCENDKPWALWGKISAPFAGVITILLGILTIREVMSGRR